MDARQEAKLQMYNTVATYCSANNSIISGNVAFMAVFDEFIEQIANINQAAQQDDQKITGITIDKNIAKQTLCGQAADLASIISAYAATIGDNTLRMQIDFSVSTLMKTREDLLAPRCRNIYEAGVANLAALAAYGVKQAMLDDLQTAIDAYSAATSKPRAAISERKTTTANLAALFKATDELLETRMDKIAIAFKSANPTFVQTYEAARRLVKPPTTPTQLKGVVTDKTTAAPVKNAVITVTPDEPDADNPPFTATSDATGAYLIKPIPVGDYNITAVALGFQNFEDDNLHVKLGDVTHYDIELEK